jgi:hypothetical protein
MPSAFACVSPDAKARINLEDRYKLMSILTALLPNCSFPPLPLRCCLSPPPSTLPCRRSALPESFAVKSGGNCSLGDRRNRPPCYRALSSGSEHTRAATLFDVKSNPPRSASCEHAARALCGNGAITISFHHMPPAIRLRLEAPAVNGIERVAIMPPGSPF